MKPIKARDVLLTLFGMLCLAAYVLACRPAFSPDGSKVLFPATDDEAKLFSVVVFDRRTQDTETIFVANGTPLASSAQWTADGTGAILVWAEYEKQSQIRVMILPHGFKSPVRVFTWEGDEGLGAWLPFCPPPVIGNYLFVAGKTSVHRLNLETGEIKKERYGVAGEAFVLTGQGNQVYFWMMIGQGEAGRFELGTIDKDTLIRTPILQIEGKDVGKLWPFLAVSPDASRIAAVSEKPLESQRGNLQKILIFRGDRLEAAIPVGLALDPITLGNIEWSRNGTVIYAAILKKDQAEGEYQLGVLEVPTTGTGMREIPLLSLKNPSTREVDDVLREFQIALSPDGKTIAAVGPAFNSVKEEDRTLYLVDLESLERRVTKIAAPPSTGSRAASKEK
jgi:hypothetical protein